MRDCAALGAVLFGAALVSLRDPGKPELSSALPPSQGIAPALPAFPLERGLLLQLLVEVGLARSQNGALPEHWRPRVN